MCGGTPCSRLELLGNHVACFTAALSLLPEAGSLAAFCNLLLHRLRHLSRATSTRTRTPLTLIPHTTPLTLTLTHSHRSISRLTPRTHTHTHSHLSLSHLAPPTLTLLLLTTLAISLSRPHSSHLSLPHLSHSDLSRRAKAEPDSNQRTLTVFQGAATRKRTDFTSCNHYGNTLSNLEASLDLPRRVPHLSPLRFCTVLLVLFTGLLNCQRPTASTADTGARDKKNFMSCTRTHGLRGFRKKKFRFNACWTHRFFQGEDSACLKAFLCQCDRLSFLLPHGTWSWWKGCCTCLV